MNRLALAVLAALLAGCAGPGPREASLDRIQTIVVIYAENHSFDNMYGMFPGANGVANATAAQKTQVDHDGTPLATLPAVYVGGKAEPKYPTLGLPNGLSHALTGLALLAKIILRMKSSLLPPDLRPMAVSMSETGGMISGRYSLLAVTTLEKLLLSVELAGERRGALKFLAIEETASSMFRAFFASLAGKLGRSKVRGVHFEETDEITIEGESSKLILDGETFSAELGSPINLRSATPLSFVKLAA